MCRTNVYVLDGLPALDADAGPSDMMAKSSVASACPRRRRGRLGIIALGIEPHCFSMQPARRSDVGGPLLASWLDRCLGLDAVDRVAELHPHPRVVERFDAGIDLAVVKLLHDAL
jgi:hypothetical protein